MRLKDRVAIVTGAGGELVVPSLKLFPEKARKLLWLIWI